MPGAEPHKPPAGIDEPLLRECGEVVAEYGARLLFAELRSLGRAPDRVERARIYPIFARHLASCIPHALLTMRAGLARGVRFADTATAFVTSIREAVLDAIGEAYPGVPDKHPGPAAPPRS